MAGEQAEIIEQGDSLLYVVKDAKGREVRTGDLPAAELRERARAQRKSLRYVAEREVERILGSGAVVAPVSTVVVDAVQPDARTLGLDELYEHFAEAGHEHELPAHEHPHQHDAYEQAHVSALVRHEETKARVAALEAASEAQGASLATHRHRPLEERLAALEAWQDAQAQRLTAVEARPVAQPAPSLEGYVTAEGLTEALAGVRRALTTLDSVTAERLNALSGRLDRAMSDVAVLVRVAALTEGDVEAIVQRVLEPRAGKRTFTLEAEQEVAGKPQLVLREV